jgi:hypothetical protein
MKPVNAPHAIETPGKPQAQAAKVDAANPKGRGYEG